MYVFVKEETVKMMNRFFEWYDEKIAAKAEKLFFSVYFFRVSEQRKNGLAINGYDKIYLDMPVVKT